jgi:hypothetical protein
MCCYLMLQIRIFDDVDAAVVEVGRHEGPGALQVVHNTFFGTRPIIAYHLIEFPDNELCDALREAYKAVRFPWCSDILHVYACMDQAT